MIENIFEFLIFLYTYDADMLKPRTWLYIKYNYNYNNGKIYNDF